MNAVGNWVTFPQTSKNFLIDYRQSSERTPDRPGPFETKSPNRSGETSGRGMRGYWHSATKKAATLLSEIFNAAWSQLSERLIALRKSTCAC
jgi:hypothetical protein